MRLTGRPTLQTLAAIGVVFLVQLVTGIFGPLQYFLFVLDPTVAARPWTLVAHVYAHAGPGHLLTNAVALAIVGPLVSRRTSTARFHVFFLTAGALGGLAEVFLGGLLGPPAGVVGASGAIFALFGYLLTGNVVTAGVLDRLDLSRRVQVVLLAVVAVLVTLATGSPRAALIGHAVGFSIGLVVGRLQLLDLSARERPASQGVDDWR
ncbi:MAG: membrane associated rhomboid family serine protease [Haloarculaceae archaeon]|jgi:membrane associated rhomboid family serine protease